MAWDYAVLSHTAKECGGPEALMKIIEGRGFQEGFWVGAEAGIKQGRIQMIPITLLVLTGSVAITVAVQNRAKIVSLFKKITKEECEAAKEALIQGIREYDESHPETEPATEPTTLQNTTAD